MRRLALAILLAVAALLAARPAGAAAAAPACAPNCFAAVAVGIEGGMFGAATGVAAQPVAVTPRHPRVPHRSGGEGVPAVVRARSGGVAFAAVGERGADTATGSACGAVRGRVRADALRRCATPACRAWWRSAAADSGVPRPRAGPIRHRGTRAIVRSGGRCDTPRRCRGLPCEGAEGMGEETEDLRQRLEDLERALDQEPDSALLHSEIAEVLFDLAEASAHMDDKAEGMRLYTAYTTRSAIHLSRACGLEPEEAGYHHRLAWDMHNLALHGMQLTEMLHAARLAPEEPEVLADLAHALEHAGRPADALHALERALAHSDDDEQRTAIRLEIAERRVDVGDVEEAERDLRELAAALPPDEQGSVLVRLGQALRRAGRLDDALDVLREALDLPDSDIEVERTIAGVLMEQGRADEAVSILEPLCEAEPEDDLLLGELGEALVAAGRPVDAVACYLAAEEIDPGYAPTQLGMGRALLAAGRRGEAVHRFRRALDLDPGNRDARSALLEAERG